MNDQNTRVALVTGAAAMPDIVAIAKNQQRAAASVGCALSRARYRDGCG